MFFGLNFVPFLLTKPIFGAVSGGSPFEASFPLIFARSEGSEGKMSCLRVPGEKTTQDVTVTSWMACAQRSFHGSIQTAIMSEVSITSARSACAVSGVVIRIVVHVPTPCRNQRVELRLCRQRVRRPRRNLAGTTLPGNRPQ